MLIAVPSLALILSIIDRVSRCRAKQKHLPEEPDQYIGIDHIGTQSGQAVRMDDLQNAKDQADS